MAKTRSKHQKDLYASYKASNRQAVNRKRKLTKLLKEFPNNEQIAAALKNISYRRRTPKTSVWSHTSKAWAQTKKLFKAPADFQATKVVESKMFQLRARAKDDQGNYVWNT